ncbi:MAG: RNA polymerase subunit sigma [Planctomycetota bacterium]|nr:MAG: RNA polymerase subunit sigma [Planctomycetota bacterium]
MAETKPQSITRLLAVASAGDDAAQQDLFDRVYSVLRDMAAGMMDKEGPGHTLDTCGLVHEAYIRLFDRGSLRWADRRHFFGAAARAMERVLIDWARRKGAKKRGGGWNRVPLQDNGAAADRDPSEILAIHEGIAKLEAMSPRQAEVVRLRYYVGFTIDETAEMMGIAPRSVDDYWRSARAWFHRELSEQDYRNRSDKPS